MLVLMGFSLCFYGEETWRKKEKLASKMQHEGMLNAMGDGGISQMLLVVENCLPMQEI